LFVYSLPTHLSYFEHNKIPEEETTWLSISVKSGLNQQQRIDMCTMNNLNNKYDTDKKKTTII